MILIVGMPIAILWALTARARLKGPLARPESKRPVESLVTEAIPEDHPDPDDEES